MLFHSRVLRGFTAGLSVRSPSISQLPADLRSSSPTMSDQDAPQTYPPPNPVQDGMKTYEVRPLLVCTRATCDLCEFVVCAFLPPGLRFSCRFIRLSTCAVLFFARFDQSAKLASNSVLHSSVKMGAGGRSGRSRCSLHLCLVSRVDGFFFANGAAFMRSYTDRPRYLVV